ncbi:MAG: S1C family serine protease [Planctomycetaceae bacterium]
MVDSPKLSAAMQQAAERVRVCLVEFVVPVTDTTTAKTLSDRALTSLPASVATQTIGLGVIIDPAGVVLTTQEVAEYRGEKNVRLANGEVVPVVSFRSDHHSELATVQIELPAKHPVVFLGNPDALEPNDWAIVVRRGTDPLLPISPQRVRLVPQDFVGQTDTNRLILTGASIGDWVEGSPIIDLSGGIVGLVCHRVSSEMEEASLGVAVSCSKNSRWLGEQLVTKGQACEQILGVVLEPVTADQIARYRLGEAAGVQVTRVIPNTPGTQAGLQVGDVVVALGPQRISSPDDLAAALHGLTPGSRKPLEIVRDGWRITASLNIPEVSLRK